jgi:hypothetical protein
MKKSFVILAFLASSMAAFGIWVLQFKSYDDLIEKSPEIIVARCVSTDDFLSGSNFVVVPVDGMHESKIEVVSVLKGTPNTNITSLGSQYWPYRGENLLIFANDAKDQFNNGYTAIESYRVISMGHFSP